jgi:hypothetical protein
MAAKRPPNQLVTLPSGVKVAYWASIGVDGEPQQRRYCIGGVDGERVPSVSTIAGFFEKPALAPAAVKLQEEAVISLARNGVNVAELTQPELRARLRQEGTHYDSVWGVARERGDIAHGVLLDLTRGRQVDFDGFAAHLHPWLLAGAQFVREERPELIDTEYIVASPRYKFAGRGDLFCRLPDGCRARVDYKTVSEWKYKRNSKGESTGKLLPPYDENLIALAGYELAAPESGYEPSDVRLIVRLGPDGNYDITESHATADVFLASLTAYREKRHLATARPALRLAA